MSETPQIQFQIPSDLNIKLRHYMIDHNIAKKHEAIIQILRKGWK